MTSLRRLGLLSLFEIYEHLKAADYDTWQRNRHFLCSSPSDGFPIPPLKLRLKVAGTADLYAFFQGGELAAASIRDILARRGVEMESLNGILDFGCGCGRALRRWSELKGVCGADYQPDLVAWCQTNLPFATVCRNGLEPPLPYARNQFDCVYALSVFTHLPSRFNTPGCAISCVFCVRAGISSYPRTASTTEPRSLAKTKSGFKAANRLFDSPPFPAATCATSFIRRNM